MTSKRHIHPARRSRISYPISLSEKIYSIVFGPIITFALLLVAAKVFSQFSVASVGSVSASLLIRATLATLSRLAIAYVLAVFVAIPLSLLTTLNSTAEKVFLPLFDILESVPILAFFPVLIGIFLKLGLPSGAAIFILFLSMLWNIVFTVVGGLKIIPSDIKAAGRIFGIRGISYVEKVLLPGVFPEIVTGSILAVAQGWNLIIVAEILHGYILGGTPSQDLFGIGSIMVNAASSGQSEIFLAALLAMVGAIAFLNFFVWQKLLHYAQRFKFE